MEHTLAEFLPFSISYHFLALFHRKRKVCMILAFNQTCRYSCGFSVNPHKSEVFCVEIASSLKHKILRLCLFRCKIFSKVILQWKYFTKNIFILRSENSFTSVYFKVKWKKKKNSSIRNTAMNQTTQTQIS